MNNNTIIKNTEATFNGFGIAPKLLEKMDSLGFKNPTPIQQKTIPVAIDGKDIIGIAQTGTGKTLAFGVPMVQRILQSKTAKGLIILPTRELAVQVDESLKKIGTSFGLKTAVLIGGASTYMQVNSLNANPHIVIGTPGRINDLIVQKRLHLSNVSILVLDEADRMFDMGFAPQIKKILLQVPQNRQTMLFSATMPDDIAKIASGHMKLPVRIEIAKQGTVSKNVEHEFFIVPKNQKLSLLKKILLEYKGSVLVFIRAKHSAGKICRDLRNVGISSSEIHSNRSLNQRRDALDGFKMGKYRVLVATDIASRGIDVKGIELVVNYDLPENPEDYVHRIGRTGRAGDSGKAISFAMPDQGSKRREIERLTRMVLPITKLPDGLPIAVANQNFKHNSQTRPQNRLHNRSSYSRRR
jgi:ATP-dependent RNA helicase RhlE